MAKDRYKVFLVQFKIAEDEWQSILFVQTDSATGNGYCHPLLPNMAGTKLPEPQGYPKYGRAEHPRLIGYTDKTTYPGEWNAVLGSDQFQKTYRIGKPRLHMSTLRDIGYSTQWTLDTAIPRLQNKNLLKGCLLI
ncbi:uncharacterized protein PFLUO_LOCUS2124 [Penicillium psychrofluorescens]|uniref:uncharacterized protein n=1 Tax=Penicillium psychrofluorescens TaxID=3158075 RepID=UPI003CCDB06F